MNTLLPIIIAFAEGSNLTMPRIIFWILLILWAVGSLGFHDNPNVVRGSNGVMLILFAILGYYVFGF